MPYPEKQFSLTGLERSENVMQDVEFVSHASDNNESCLSLIAGNVTSSIFQRDILALKIAGKNSGVYWFSRHTGARIPDEALTWGREPVLSTFAQLPGTREEPPIWPT